MIEFSKFLATIKIDVPITLNMDELKREEPDEEELRKIFEEMEFRTLIDRVFNREKKTASAGATSMSHDKAQGSLFGDQPSLFDQPSTSPSSQASSQGNLFAEFEDENTGNGNYSNLACLENSKYDYQLIDTEEKRTELIQKLLTKETFSLDTETTGTDPITAKLVGMSFSYTENQAFYVPVPAEQNEAQKLLMSSDRYLKSRSTESGTKYQVRYAGARQLRSRGLRSAVRHYGSTLCAATRTAP